MGLSRCGDPGRLNAEQWLECRPSAVATDGELSKNIKIVAEGQARLKGDQQSSLRHYRYASSVRPRGNELASEELHWDDRHVLSAGKGRRTKIDGQDSRQ